jgi:hypothetical protein
MCGNIKWKTSLYVFKREMVYYDIRAIHCYPHISQPVLGELLTKENWYGNFDTNPPTEKRTVI